MFQLLENRIKRTLFLFFTLFVLLINIFAFYATAGSMRQNAMQLALSYAKQQEQSFQLRIQLLEETDNLLLQNSIMGENLLSGDADGRINALATDYLQSSLYISDIQIFTVNGYEYMSRAVSAPLSLDAIRETVSQSEQMADSLSLWYVRAIPTNITPYGYLTYITGITDASDQLMGYLVFDTDLRRIFGLFDTGDSDSFRTSALAIHTQADEWVSAGSTDLLRQAAAEMDGDYILTEGQLIYQARIPKSNDHLVMAVPGDTGTDYWMPALICAASAAVFIVIGFFSIRALSDSIIQPLRALYQKIRHFMSQKQPDR